MPKETIRVPVYERKQPEDLAGTWVACPHRDRPVRIFDCMGCQRSVEFHVTCADDPFMLCSAAVGEVDPDEEAEPMPIWVGLPP
jgi:hypothetical protein